jgi:hypothetical protein
MLYLDKPYRNSFCLHVKAGGWYVGSEFARAV